MADTLCGLQNFLRHYQHKPPALLIFLLLFFKCRLNPNNKTVSVAVAKPLYIAAVITLVFFLDTLDLRQYTIYRIFENSNAYL